MKIREIPQITDEQRETAKEKELSRIVDEMTSRLQKRFVLTDEQAMAAAIWCAGTYFFEMFDYFPELVIASPDESAAEALLDAVSAFVHRPLPYGNVRPSALFQALHHEEGLSSTLLVSADEWENAGEELRIFSRVHHTKRKAFFIELVDGEEKRLDLWRPMARVGRAGRDLDSSRVTINLHGNRNPGDAILFWYETEAIREGLDALHWDDYCPEISGCGGDYAFWLREGLPSFQEALRSVAKFARKDEVIGAALRETMGV